MEDFIKFCNERLLNTNKVNHHMLEQKKINDLMLADIEIDEHNLYHSTARHKCKYDDVEMLILALEQIFDYVYYGRHSCEQFSSI